MKNLYKIPVMLMICFFIVHSAYADLSADFSADQTIIMAGNPIQFTDLSTGNPTSWEWDFENDGTIDCYEQNPEWTYNEIGIYSVSLTISDGTNEDTELKEDYITVIEAQAPILVSATPGWGTITLLWEPIPGTKTDHFTFEGGNPADPVWTIYIGEAKFDGTDMEAGDEIGIFDGSLLVGAFTLDQLCTPDNQFDNDLIAFQTLTNGPGYIPGNSFTLVAWDESEQIESYLFEYIFSDPYGSAWTGDVFPTGDGQYSMAEFSFSSYVPSIFNVYYADGTLIAAGVEGNTYTDIILKTKYQYYYYVTQIMECGIESNPSNVLGAYLQPPLYGVIAGTITNGIYPIEGAEITLEGTNQTAITGANGVYMFERVESGTYNVTVNAEGYCTETKYDQSVVFGETTMVDFTLAGIQTYNLVTGYQFISTCFIPENPDMFSVVEEILNDNLDFIRNSQGFSLRKIGPNWINGIGEWIVDEGYLVKMFADDSFSINGYLIDPSTPIFLETGFQFVSYFPNAPIDALDAYANIIGDDLDFVRNSQGQTLRKIGSNWVNGIGDCQPGEGYLIKMFADSELVYLSGEQGITSINENFQGQYDSEDINILGWLNINEIGSRKWIGRQEYYFNIFAQATSYNSNEENIFWLITPKMALDEMNSPIFSFESAQAFWNHDGLSVLISTDFDGSEIDAATWTPLDCIIAGQNHPFLQWIYSGLIDLSSYSGGAYIAFRYSGNDNAGETTFYRIDNVILDDENKSTKSVASIEESKNHWKNIIGDPSRPVWTIYFEKGVLEQGDEIAVYDGGNLIGVGLVASDNILENDIPVFSNLYEVGNKPIIKAWDKNENKEYIISDYTFSNPYGDAWTENVFPAEDGEYSLLHFSTAGILDANPNNTFFTIYPNPSKGIFNISLEGVMRNISIKVFDLRGKEYSNFELNGSTSTQLDLRDLPAGVYFISFSGNDFCEVKKIVIK